ncbi:MAG: hypothetical protein PHD37_17660 [Gallionellaceae bacterium]|nr:hypothetical protein [Gallionellaceae bacterium]
MLMRREVPYKNERWFLLLKQAVADSSVTAVAAKIGYGRPAVSQVLNGIYLGKPDKIAACVMALFDRWQCPYLNTVITGEECRAVHACPTPSHDPARLSQRRMCKTCKHRHTLRKDEGDSNE